MRYIRDLGVIKALFPDWQPRKAFSDYFIVKNWNQNPLPAFLVAQRGAFYKVFHVTSGTAFFAAGLHNYLLTAGDVAFIKPDEVITWRTLSPNIEGHFCFVHPKFFKHANHVLQMFLTFPHSHPAPAVVPLSQLQSENMKQSFELMHYESIGNFDDKKQAILLHLQMILLKVRRAGRAKIVPRSFG